MNQTFDEFASNRVFYDNRHYPRGFQRSGEFTLRQADLLSRHGALLKDLTEGRLAPTNEAQEALLAVVRSEREAQTELEKVWLKYWQRTSHRPIRYTCATAELEHDYWTGDLTDA